MHHAREKLPPKTGLDFGAMMDDIDREEELKQESTNLEKQIDQLRSVTWTLEEDQVTVVQASGSGKTEEDKGRGERLALLQGLGMGD